MKPFRYLYNTFDLATTEDENELDKVLKKFNENSNPKKTFFMNTVSFPREINFKMKISMNSST